MSNNKDTAEKSFDREELERLVDAQPRWAGKVYAAARYYGSIGWPIVPVQYGKKQLCYPDQAKKRGLTRAPAYEDATTAPDKIKHWFHPEEGLWKGMNLGLVCGDSVSVVDLDVKEGKDGVSEFTRLYGSDFGRTPIAETPTGGRHIVFQHDPAFLSRVGVLTGVDTRGASNKGSPASHIVVFPSVVDMPGSSNNEKRAYKWVQGGPPAQCPPDFLDRISKVVEFKAKPGPGRGNENLSSDDYFPDATLQDLREALGHVPADCDYDTWRIIGMAIHSEFPGDDGFDVWHDWSKTVDNGLPIKKGGGNPYHGKGNMWTKWNTFSAERGGITVGSLFHFARENGYRKPGEMSPELGETLRFTAKGDVARSAHNLWIILQSPEFQEEFGGRLKYNQFFHQVEAGKKIFVNEEYTRIARWISTKFHVEYGHEVVRSYARMVSMDNSYDALKEYVENLVWDGKDRLQRLTQELCCANDYERAAVKRWLIGGVARATRPGCTSTHMLVLYGEQGVGKSRFFRALCPNPDWFTDAIVLKFGRGDAAHRDQEVLLQGKWLVEIPELAGIWKSDDNDTKNWLTLQSPRVSRKYDPDATEMPRRVLFGGTTNLDMVIQDSTGSRRFAFLTIGGNKIDVPWVEKNAEQIWAQAKTWLDSGENWWFDDTEFAQQVEANQAFRQIDPWEDAIIEWAEDKSRFVTDDIYDHVITLERAQRTQRDTNRFSKILQSHGFKKRNIKVNGKTRKAWINPDETVDAEFVGAQWGANEAEPEI